MTVRLAGPDDTARLGECMGRWIVEATLIRLMGPLGAGKTHLVQGLARGLEIPDADQVRSPSFALVRVHGGGRLPLVHVDLYRLGDPRELTELGLEEYEDGVTAVEWADRFADGLEGGIAVDLRYTDDGGRVARIDGNPGLLDAIADAFA